MLFPYTKRLLSLDLISRDYFPTLMNDLEIWQLTGNLLLLDDELSQVVTFLDGKAISSVMWRRQEGVRRFYKSDHDIFQNLPENVAMELFSAEKDAVAMTEVFCRSKSIWSGPAQIATSAGGVQTVASSLETVILSRVNNGVCELALMEKGQFTLGYCFDSDSRTFTRTGKSFLETNSDPQAVFSVFKPELISPMPQLQQTVNPLEITADKYILVFQIAETVLENTCNDKTAAALDKLVEQLKSKYPPLYKGVYRNPETGQVNWSLMLSNRDKVDRAYRYDKFLLYFDELLMGHIKLLHAHCKQDGLKCFFEKIEKLKELTPDATYPPVEHFFDKLEKIARRLLAG